MHQILAFDPGGATGWAHYISMDELRLLDSGTFWKGEHHLDIYNLIMEKRQVGKDACPLTIVTESFEFRQSPDSAKQRRGLELVSRDYIGIMKLASQKYGIPIVQQMPAHAKRFMTDEKLEKLGYLHKPLHEHRHEHDALRHLFFYLIVTKNEHYWKDMLKA